MGIISLFVFCHCVDAQSDAAPSVLICNFTICVFVLFSRLVVNQQIEDFFFIFFCNKYVGLPFIWHICKKNSPVGSRYIASQSRLRTF
jgi:hypothetical protein